MKYFLIILLAILLIGCDYLFRFACDSKFKPIGKKKKLNMGDKSAFDKLREELKTERDILLARPHEEITSKSFDRLDLHADLFTCENPDRIVVCVHGYKGNGIKDMRWSPISTSTTAAMCFSSTSAPAAKAAADTSPSA